TKNVETLHVSLYRINQRNLISSINQYSLIRGLMNYQLDQIEKEEGYKLWTKTLNIRNAVPNVTRTTAIPVGDFLKKRQSGVYILHVAMLNKEGKEIYAYDPKMQWFMLSDIGLFTLKSKKGLDVLTKTLSSAQNYDGVKLELIAKNNEILDTTVSKDGHAFFPDAVLKGTKGLQAKAIYAYGKENDFSVINLSKPTHDLSDRGVKGRVSSGDYDAFVYSNRDIFKPGETVHLHTLLRDTTGIAKPHTAVSMQVQDAKGETVHTTRFTTDDSGHFATQIPIENTATTGKWHVALFAGSKKEIGHYNFLVEDFVPPKIKVTLNTLPKSIKPYTQQILMAKASYLNGEVFPDANVEVTSIIHQAKHPFKAYGAYHFGDIKEKFQNEIIDPISLRSDKEGEIHIPLSIIPRYESSKYSSLPLALHIDIAVNELGGRPVHKIIQPYFANKPHFIGIKANFKNNAIDMEAHAKFDIVYLNEGVPENASLHYTIVKEKTHWNWRSRGESWEYYRTYTDESTVKKGTLTSTETKPTTLRLDTLDWGSYRLIVKDGNNTLSSYRFSSGYSEGSAKSSPDRLPLSIDKQTYHVGDTLRVQVTPKFTGPVELYIANDTLMQKKHIDATAGTPVEVSFVVDKSWGSSVYVLASAFRAQSKKLGADRAIGLAHVHILHPEQSLELSLTHPKQSTSSSTVEVTIHAKNLTETKGYVTLSAVDEGVLNLTEYQLPDPTTYFLGQRQLDIEIRDIYAELIKPRGAHAQFNVGAGDMEGALFNAIQDAPISNHRKITSLFSDVVHFDSQGMAKVTLEIPDYQGSLTLNAIAWTQKATGSVESHMVIKDRISIAYYRPLFLSVNDTANTLLHINFDNTLESGTYHIKLSTQGGVTLDKSTFDVNLTKGKTIHFMQALTLQAKQQKEAHITLEVSKADKILRTKVWDMSIRAMYPQTYTRTMGVIPAKETLHARSLQDTKNWSNVQDVRLTLSSKALLPVGSLAEELMDYQGRCAEQTTSRAMPWLFASKDNVHPTLVKHAIERLLSYQKMDGGFGLWNNSKNDMWLSAYVLDFLTRAQAKGYPVSQHAIKQGLAWLENHLNRWEAQSNDQEANVYALYVLARSGRTLMSEINFYTRTKKTKLHSALAWGQLASTLVYVGETDLAEKLFTKAKNALAQSTHDGYFGNYGASLRDEASLVALLQESSFTTEAQSLFADLSLHVKKQHYLSTQELSTLLRASFVTDTANNESMTLSINKKEQTFEKKPYHVEKETLDKLPTLKNLGTSALWYDLSFKATPLASSYTSKENNGFTLRKTIYTLDGKAVDMAHIAQNARLMVVIDGNITHPAIEHPLITDWVIAGFEVENPNLTGIDATQGLVKQSPVTHAAYRTDRYEAALSYEDNDHTYFRVAYIVRAVTTGSYTLPPAKIEDMYQARYRAFSHITTIPVKIEKK
ncbi:MAG TPA: alpha-2-macroglobulin family protein, partial [Epsilonproteobacteria bacterium]|nr:alpha-2-macroglobulin family protein [Campylobacterota bacterium]